MEKPVLRGVGKVNANPFGQQAQEPGTFEKPVLRSSVPKFEPKKEEPKPVVAAQRPQTAKPAPVKKFGAD
jgi:hypothetical protein